MIATANHTRQIINRDQLKDQAIRSLERDRDNARKYARMCKQYIDEAGMEGDRETVAFWANIHDNQIEQIALIDSQLKQYRA